ncbi:HlyC/CorC family transporter [Sulfitobacter albidus]|uniref:HlyC/CorC family transporter n=1 Tax=Sulfitobacter albidus TaxID=2829501 RepID=A0A975PLQ1_9RHOB|nr:hemolysin family protein [Sulfitobacter albidus]QUJ75410.1 HlyC/CorC family transporter [Sulfitobacter albidus]
MGDTDGSSGAAHGARPQTTPDTDASAPDADETSKAGFFSRVIGALSPAETPGSVEMVHATPDRAATGMGNLRRMRVDDVMVPKADITAVPVTADMDELVAVFKDSGMTRLPVYEGTLDTPVGMAHLKDLALTHGFNGKPRNFNLADMVRPLVYVPPSMTIGVLLTKMQAERRHMALVIDEYGGVDGLVTIEDLIEQVVGQIEDEHDVEEDQLWTEEKPGQYLAFAKTPLRDFEEEIGQSLTDHDTVDEEEIDTLGGLVFMLSGTVPARGEVVVHPDGPEFEVLEADPRRIKRLRVRVNGAAGG